MNRVCTAKGIWLEGGFAGGEFWLVVIIKVKVSSQAAAETHCWLQSHNVSLSLLGRPHHHLGSNQPTLLPPAAGTLLLLLLLCSTGGKTAAENFLRAFRARSRDPADRDGVFSDDGQRHTREGGRVATWWWRQSCWCRGGNELGGSAGAPHMVQKVHRPAKRGSRQSGEDVL